MRAFHTELDPSRTVRLAIVASFAFGMLWYVVYSWRWPLIWDMQVMHYVSFLMDHGWAPYRQIGDMNMPGAYLFEHWALRIFGDSDLGWRFWDFTLCASLLAGALSITRTYNWLAGLLAGGSFTLLHAAEGPMNAGQRDQVIATLLVVATALVLESVRRHNALLLYFFGLATAMAAFIKPTVAVFAPVALALALRQLRREGVPSVPYLLSALSGFATATLIVLAFLIRFHSLGAFVHLVMNTLPHYAGINHPAWWRLILWTAPASVFLYTLLAVLARQFSATRLWNWEQAMLVLGIVTGLISYYGQHKGFFQHRYTTVAFVLIWASLQLFPALSGGSLSRRLAMAALLILLLNTGRTLYWIRAKDSFDYFSSYLEQDLGQLGVDQLQHKVQCLDIVDGCLNALFHLKIVQSTGSTGDLLLFLKESAPPVEAARADFWETVHHNPPLVYVLGNWQFGVAHRTFTKLDAWPEFRQYLESEYVLVQQREFPFDGKPTSALGTNPSEMPAYRIYVRRGSPLLLHVAMTQTP